ncbi:uncharacterized protein LOC125644733 [Caretta caretta]|uniref:uncharacterized protein LOC125644733 n=1 Tax=Caretta caretta TaxID=8467 RepID=UPI003F4B53AC
MLANGNSVPFANQCSGDGNGPRPQQPSCGCPTKAELIINRKVLQLAHANFPIARSPFGACTGAAAPSSASHASGSAGCARPGKFARWKVSTRIPQPAPARPALQRDRPTPRSKGAAPFPPAASAPGLPPLHGLHEPGSQPRCGLPVQRAARDWSREETAGGSARSSGLCLGALSGGGRGRSQPAGLVTAQPTGRRARSRVAASSSPCQPLPSRETDPHSPRSCRLLSGEHRRSASVSAHPGRETLALHSLPGASSSPQRHTRLALDPRKRLPPSRHSRQTSRVLLSHPQLPRSYTPTLQPLTSASTHPTGAGKAPRATPSAPCNSPSVAGRATRCTVKARDLDRASQCVSAFIPRPLLLTVVYPDPLAGSYG